MDTLLGSGEFDPDAEEKRAAKALADTRAEVLLYEILPQGYREGEISFEVMLRFAGSIVKHHSAPHIAIGRLCLMALEISPAPLKQGNKNKISAMAYLSVAMVRRVKKLYGLKLSTATEKNAFLKVSQDLTDWGFDVTESKIYGWYYPKKIRK